MRKTMRGIAQEIKLLTKKQREVGVPQGTRLYLAGAIHALEWSLGQSKPVTLSGIFHDNKNDVLEVL